MARTPPTAEGPRTSTRATTFALALVFALGCGAAGAEPWRDLSPKEQELLAPHRAQWERYSPDQQRRLREGVQRFLELSPAEREAVRQEQREFRSLTPEERRTLQEQYKKQRR